MGGMIGLAPRSRMAALGVEICELRAESERLPAANAAPSEQVGGLVSPGREPEGLGGRDEGAAEDKLAELVQGAIERRTWDAEPSRQEEDGAVSKVSGGLGDECLGATAGRP
jgi:hypothetical protein